MKNFTLKQFRYFDALARQGHFGRAASVCAISQPALSMQIKEMETEIGAPLFERGPRQVRLTRLGEEVAGRIRDILRAVDEVGDMARAVQGGLAGRIRLGVIPTIAPYLLPTLIAKATAAHQGLELEVRETVTAKLINELGEGRLDAAILALPVSEPSLVAAPLAEEEFVLVRPATDAGQPVPDREGLREMRLLLLEEGHCFRHQAIAVCGGRSALGRDGMDGSTLTTLVQMVGAGLGATLIPQMAVAVETRSAPVTVDRLRSARPMRRIGMVWRRASPLAPHLAELSQTVAAAAKAVCSGVPLAPGSFADEAPDVSSDAHPQAPGKDIIPVPSAPRPGSTPPDHARHPARGG